MMDMGYVSNEIQDTLALLDGAEMPETYQYLSTLLGDEDAIPATPYEIANTILGLDKPRRFPDFLIDFLIDMFELEIAEENDDAMNDLGAQYYDGSRGFEQSFEKAVRYYTMAAEKGNRQAQENLR